jgi:hypothetical protein
MADFKLTPVEIETEFKLTPTETEEVSSSETEAEFKLTSTDSDSVNQPSTDEGWGTGLGGGIIEGLTKIPQGIIELFLEGTDYVADTQNARQFNLWADKTRKDFGIDPQGAVGTIASGITQFAVPGLGAASAVSKLSKLGKVKNSHIS